MTCGNKRGAHPLKCQGGECKFMDNKEPARDCEMDDDGGTMCHASGWVAYSFHAFLTGELCKTTPI